MKVNSFHTTASFAELVGIAKEWNAQIGVSTKNGVTTVKPRDKYAEEIVKEQLEVLDFGWWHF